MGVCGIQQAAQLAHEPGDRTENLELSQEVGGRGQVTQVLDHR